VQPGLLVTGQESPCLTGPFPGGQSYLVQVTPPEGEPLTRTVTLPPGHGCLQVLFQLPGAWPGTLCLETGHEVAQLRHSGREEPAPGVSRPHLWMRRPEIGQTSLVAAS
jgi:hypothetical protein